jgi:hypothetical protein
LLAQLREELAEIEATNDEARKRAVIERYVRQITVETRRVESGQLAADVRLSLRFKPDSLQVETPTSACRRP